MVKLNTVYREMPVVEKKKRKGAATSRLGNRNQANMAHTRQSRPDSGLCFEVQNILNPVQASPLRAEAASSNCVRRVCDVMDTPGIPIKPDPRHLL